ncbi:YdeI/OmpD-associated family protein [Nocardioides pacificus]
MTPDLPELLVPDAAAWRAWLVEHHTDSPGVWLVIHKIGGDVTSLTYEEAVREALCFGWIDGQARRRDAGSRLQRLTPRRPRSVWSASNVARVALLEGEGRMTEAGRAQVRAAQADGRWEAALDEHLVAPDDLAAALAAAPAAQAMFDVLTKSNREAILGDIKGAKRSETRERRIAKYVEMLARHETPFGQKRRPD